MNAIDSFKNHFNELKLVRKSAADLNHSDFEAMSNLVLDAEKEGVLQEAEELCLHFIKENKDILIALYPFALLHYCQNKNGDDYIKQLVLRLQDKGCDNVIDLFLGEVSARHQSADLLRLVAGHYEKLGRFERAAESWQQIILIDREDFNIPLNLGKYYEKKDTNQALHYYQMAFKRSLSRGVHDQFLKILQKLIVLFPLMVHRHLENLKLASINLSAQEKHDLYAFLLKNQEKNGDNAMHFIVMIIKAALQENVVLYNQIFLLIKAYREIYKDHELLENFLVYSNLLAEIKNKKRFKSAKVLLNIVEVFEKYIQFHRGSFVRHKSFGYGVLRDLKQSGDLAKKEEIRFFIDFEKKPNHQMALHIGLTSLVVVSAQNLYCLKMFKPEALKELLIFDKPQANAALLSAILETLGKPAQKKDIMLLMNHFIESDQWNDCWDCIRKSISETDEFTEIDRAIWFRGEQEDLLSSTLSQLEKTSDPISQIKIVDSFLPSLEKKEQSYTAILEHLVLNIDKKNKYALLFLVYLSHVVTHHRLKHTFDFAKTFERLFDEESFILNFEIAPYASLRQIFFSFCHEYLSAEVCRSTLKKLFYTLEDFKDKEVVVEHLASKGQKDFINELFQYVNNRFFEDPSSFFALVHYFFYKSKESFSQGELLEKSICLLDYLHRGIDYQANRGMFKKLFTAVKKLIFENDRIFLYLQNSDDSLLVEKIFASLEKTTFLENDIKIKIRTLHERIGRESK